MGMWVPSMQSMIWGIWNFCSNRHTMAMASSAVGILIIAEAFLVVAESFQLSSSNSYYPRSLVVSQADY